MHYDESYVNKMENKSEKMVQESLSLYSYWLFFYVFFLYIYFLSNNFQFLIPFTAAILYIFLVLESVHRDIW